MKKNILITGTSSGVGLAASILLAKNNYKVYATMRNLKKSTVLKEAIAKDNLDIEILELDVTKYDTIEHAVNMIVEKDGKIDVLLNNAGAGFAKTLEQTSLDQIDWITDVNYKGVVITTKAVLPIMRKMNSGHIINITSIGGLVGQPFNELYCGAKFAVEGFTEALATYVAKPFNINFSLIEPGGIATEFMNNAITKTVDEKGEMVTGEYAPIFTKYLEGAKSRAGSGTASPYQTPEEIAAIILDTINAKNPPLRVRTSEWAENMTALKVKADPDGTKLVNQVIDYFL
ncbi:SDR family oxidoreductase [Aquimarina agarivorans]|uniref:SDR family oxidoreductase n=1 Tax=Aquimarina agarivorans TaxID=980584 RepID=UPI000248F000|nr:SDR family oxidoreductase [Aquimarina agarivorans]